MSSKITFRHTGENPFENLNGKELSFIESRFLYLKNNHHLDMKEK